MELTEYNRDQLEALLMVDHHLRGLSTSAATELKHMIQPSDVLSSKPGIVARQRAGR
jgi:hypothetical protein